MSYIKKFKDRETGEICYEVGILEQDGVDRDIIRGEQAWERALHLYRLGVKYSRGFPPKDDLDPLGLTIPEPSIIDMTRWPIIIVGEPANLN